MERLNCAYSRGDATQQILFVCLFIYLFACFLQPGLLGIYLLSDDFPAQPRVTLPPCVLQTGEPGTQLTQRRPCRRSLLTFSLTGVRQANGPVRGSPGSRAGSPPSGLNRSWPQSGESEVKRSSHAPLPLLCLGSGECWDGDAAIVLLAPAQRAVSLISGAAAGGCRSRCLYVCHQN